MNVNLLNINMYKKIYRSYLSLQYHDPNMENSFQQIRSQNIKGYFAFFNHLLLFLEIFLTTFIGLLYYSNPENKNIKWNFYFSVLQLVLSFILFIIENFSKLKDKESLRIMLNFFLHICYDSFFLSLQSVMIVYFKIGIEIVTFIFLLKTILILVISLLLHRSFISTLSAFTYIFTFKLTFLLGIHVIKAIIYYLIMSFVFNLVILVFVYMYELMTRNFFYSFEKLGRKKEYFLETMNFFNISYFSSRNKFLKKSIKMDRLLSSVKPQDRISNFKKIQELMKNLISVDSIPKEIETYMNESKNKKNFKFKNLLKIVASKEEFKETFKKLQPIGVIKLMSADNSEENYYQVFLKIKIKESLKNGITPDNIDREDYLNSLSYKGFDVKFEGLFLDITQFHIKKQVQANSLILAKYIHDVKSPLVLLDQMVKNYNKFLKKFKKGNSNFCPQVDHTQSQHQTQAHEIKLFNKGKNGNKFVLRKSSEFTLNENLFKFSSESESNLHDLDEFSNYIKIISKSIFEMIENINTFTKKQNKFACSKMLETEVSQVDVRRLINECVDFYKIYVKFNTTKSNLKVYSDIEGHVPQFIITNRNSLKMILMNLLSNAMKFTYHGEVKLICKMKSKVEFSEKKFLEISVVDTGIGIDQEYIDQIGKPFSYTSGQQYGSGLGLSIVNDLLASIKSKLSFYSFKNKGSCFCFEIALPSPKLYYNSVISDDNNESFDSEKTEDERKEKNINSKNINQYPNFNSDNTNKIYNRLSSNNQVNPNSNGGNINAVHTFPIEKKLDNSFNSEDRMTVKYDYTLQKPNFEKDLIKFFQNREESGPLQGEIINAEDYEKFFKVSNEINSKNNNLEEEIDLTNMVTLIKTQKSVKDNMTVCNTTINKIKRKFSRKKNILNIPLEEEPHSICYDEMNNTPKTYKLERDEDRVFDKDKSPRYLTQNTSHSLVNIDPLLDSSHETRFKILIIDDDPNYLNQIRDVIKSACKFSKRQVEIETACDPIEGLGIIHRNLKEKNEIYNLVFTDENMPFMRGSYFVKIYNDILSKNGFYKIPFVSVSSEVVTLNQEMKKYFDFYINKPCRKSQIKSILKNFLQLND
jgi:signal transduction histidine kinase/CheY-like chemotaxis protein